MVCLFAFIDFLCWFLSILFFQAPIKESLILYNDPEISDISVQCFMSECYCKYMLWANTSIHQYLKWICPSRPHAVYGWHTNAEENLPFRPPQEHFTGVCVWSIYTCLFWSECLMCIFCSVREGKGAAARWNFLPGHQANNQQSKPVSYCFIQ